jgi:uncharacterized protein (TIGR02996 family)
MTLEQAFVQSIVERPSDDAPRLIYADWLQERGDAESGARAEFIRLQCLLEQAGEQNAHRTSWEKRTAELLERYGSAWSAGVSGSVIWFAFRRGFIAEARLSVDQFLAHAEVLFREHPLESVCVLAAGDEAERLAGSAYLNRVHRLSIHDPHAGDASVGRLAAAGCLEQLEALVLHGCGLTADGARVLAGVPFRCLVHLDLGANEIGDPGLAALAASPGLRSLRVLRLGATDLGPEGVEALAGSPYLGDLEKLSLGANELNDPAVARLARAPLLSSLDGLDLRYNGFGDEGARALAASPYLRDLNWLDVSQNNLTSAGEQALRHRFGVRVNL